VIRNAGAVIFECVPNVSEGRDVACSTRVRARSKETGATLAHRTSDAGHHRSVFTFFGERDAVLAAAVALARVTTERIDLRAHRGAHPRIGALDVCRSCRSVRRRSPMRSPLGARCGTRDLARTPRSLGLFYGAAATSEHGAGCSPTYERASSKDSSSAAIAADRPTSGTSRRIRAPAPLRSARARSLIAFNVVLASRRIWAWRRTIARTPFASAAEGFGTLRALGIAQADGKVQVSCNLTDRRGHAAAARRLGDRPATRSAQRASRSRGRS
jgi:glutamate formiminotransferase/formiminotetrahydrofolate cyclodeaminase